MIRDFAEEIIDKHYDPDWTESLMNELLKELNIGKI